MHTVAIGVDTETYHGEPITFQFFSPEIGLEKIVWLKRGRDSTRNFFAFLDSLPGMHDRHFVLYGHNLAFDMVSLFYDRHSILRSENVKATWYGWRVEIVYAAVRFASFKRGNKSVTLIDTGAYFFTSLANLAAMLCPNLPKLEQPEGLGNTRYKRTDQKFCAYAMRDAEISYHAGVFLMERHREWDVSLAVSAPHFASKVFRRHFLKKIIPLPPRKVTYAALTSYHGGKNGITVGPGLYKGVTSLDIKSAYPYAMSMLPSFSNPKLYFTLKGDGTAENVPPFGIYKVTGKAKPCKWPVVFDHAFKPVEGDFSGIWTTGFELNEGLRTREVTVDHLEGYFYDAAADKEPSPFAAYVNEFFKRKETAETKPMREFNKLLMNALYGKFIQTRHLIAAMADIVYDLDAKKLIEDSSILAGGLFNPFIATLITGHCRAYVHRLEHKYAAIHTATDGIQTQKRVGKLNGSGALGSVSVENSGDSLILRNKLYIMYAKPTRAEKRSHSVEMSTIFAGKKIVKYALHGFHADKFTLEKMWKTGVREYEYTKVNRLRESVRRNLKVNDFVTTRATVKLAGDA